ncbi:MAG TPA: hypothetical protein DD490_16280 [Acidobacteria bacterium]|nr:hypothetical protein [Acidobacteriota bacterium]
MYPDQINEQKRILHEQLHAEPAREALQTVAQILQDRWKAKPDLFFSEFYYFRDTSRGPALIAELSQLDSGRDDLGHFLRKVATQSDRLQLWMDDER